LLLLLCANVQGERSVARGLYDVNMSKLSYRTGPYLYQREWEPDIDHFDSSTVAMAKPILAVRSVGRHSKWCYLQNTCISWCAWGSDGQFIEQTTWWNPFLTPRLNTHQASRRTCAKHLPSSDVDKMFYGRSSFVACARRPAVWTLRPSYSLQSVSPRTLERRESAGTGPREFSLARARFARWGLWGGTLL